MRDELIDEKIRQDILDTKLAEAAELEGCPCTDCEHNGTCNGSPLCEDYVAWADERIKSESPKLDIDSVISSIKAIRTKPINVCSDSFAVAISKELFEKLNEQRKRIEPYEKPSKLYGIDFYVSKKLKGGHFIIGLKEEIEKEIKNENQ